MLDHLPVSSVHQPMEIVVPTQPRRLEISLARSKSDLLGAFRILYNAYLRAGLASENSKQLRLTPYHLHPSTEVVVAKLEETVTSTMTMVFDEGSGVPMEEIYPEELQELRRQGYRFAEIGCLADRRQSAVRFIKVFGELARLIVQVAQHRGVNALVVATHPRHAAFYQRSFAFEPFGECRGCPYVKGNPAVAQVLKFSRIEGTELHDVLFGNPFDVSQLSRPAWDSETVAELREALAIISSASSESKV